MKDALSRDHDLAVHAVCTLRRFERVKIVESGASDVVCSFC